ncbi:hypothetical protein BSKO_06996 [Bryopsis sp. KO-2023]|nr:hypothetical protein BSKO_06996 [Bryopsis sp. KO-2023]
MIKTSVLVEGPRVATRMGIRHGLRAATGRLRGDKSGRSITSGAAQHLTPERMERTTSKLQILYNLAKSTFSKQQIPSQQSVASLLEAMCAVPLEELGMGRLPDEVGRSSGESTASGEPEWPGAITYLGVREEAGLHVGIFCLPANAVLPLHDHPGMTVLSRLLYGKMHMRAYQWADEGRDGNAKLIADGQLKGSESTSVCFPNHANIHAFRAITPCAVLDVMSPPYDVDEGRDCTYYREVFPAAVQETDDGLINANANMLVRLEPCNPPRSLYVRHGTYSGVVVEGTEE